MFYRYLLALFVIIQLFPSGRQANNPISGQDLFENTDVPGDAGHLLKTACYDCHSQHVRYPWYSYVAPVSWLVAKDVNMGREHLDFGKWAELSRREKIKVLGEVSEIVEDGFMPMQIYITMHSEADLTEEQRDIIVDWADAYAEEILEN